MQGLSPLVIFFASIFTGNILLTYFLGMCSFLSVSKQIKTALGLGLAVTCVMTITAALNYFVYTYILVPMNIVYLRYIVFIVIIAATVQLIEMFIEKYSEALYINLGIFLPLITVNCAILGVSLFMVIREYSFIQSVAFGSGSGLGWLLAILAMAGKADTRSSERAWDRPHYHGNYGHGLHGFFRDGSNTIGVGRHL
jgi:Na+-transporting NADH:ubiquinone oxidoreductase subunit E